jgi:hypothetical protein
MLEQISLVVNWARTAQKSKPETYYDDRNSYEHFVPVYKPCQWPTDDNDLLIQLKGNSGKLLQIA